MEGQPRGDNRPHLARIYTFPTQTHPFIRSCALYNLEIPARDPSLPADARWVNTRRRARTSKKPSPSSTSAVQAVYPSIHLATYYVLVDKTLLLQKSASSKGRSAETVSASPHSRKRRQALADPEAIVDFDAFTRVLNRPGGFRDPGEPEEYCRGFQVFDKDLTGFIGVGQFRYILTNLGEKMSDEEVDELLKAVDTSSGELNYMDMVKTILAN